MTKDDIIILLVKGVLKQENTAILKFKNDIYELVVGFGTNYVWHGRMQGGTYFCFFTNNEEIVNKEHWDIYGVRQTKDKDKSNEGQFQYVCMTYLYL